jgi:hypothetical protein
MSVRHQLRWDFLLLVFILVSGCSTDESSRPWNRPTRADTSKDWWFKNGYDDPSLGRYP